MPPLAGFIFIPSTWDPEAKSATGRFDRGIQTFYTVESPLHGFVETGRASATDSQRSEQTASAW
jgi:hypothetical protein